MTDTGCIPSLNMNFEFLVKIFHNSQLLTKKGYFLRFINYLTLITYNFILQSVFY
jgi:hypothetical protein